MSSAHKNNFPQPKEKGVEVLVLVFWFFGGFFASLNNIELRFILYTAVHDRIFVRGCLS